jgi:GNAT superfamily N-acetyltransferase
MGKSVHGAAETGASDRHPIWHEKLRDGTAVTIRPIRGEDAGIERRFIDELSPESREFRFLGQMGVSDDMVRRFTNVDPKTAVALVALLDAPGEERAIGVGRFHLDKDRATCECALAVSDEWQGRGLGYSMMHHLIDIARERGVRRMYSIDSASNHKMRELAASCGFERAVNPDYPSEAIHSLKL